MLLLNAALVAVGASSLNNVGSRFACQFQKCPDADCASLARGFNRHAVAAAAAHDADADCCLQGLGQAFLSGAHTYRHWLGADGLLLGLFCITFLLITTMPPAENAAQVQQQQEQPHPLPEISHCTNECQQTDQHPQDQHHLDSLRSQSQVEAGIATNDPHTVVTATALTLSPAATAAGCSRQHGCGSTSSSRSGIIQSLPSALLVVLLGLVITPIAHPEVLSGLRLGPSIPSFAVPSLGQLQTGIRKAGIAQLPLTSLNSVVAVSQLAAELFPARGAAEGWRWQPSFVASSVGLMNLLGVWFGAFPCCHGAGGLAAQVRGDCLLSYKC
jgi:hypothetical protein